MQRVGAAKSGIQSPHLQGMGAAPERAAFDLQQVELLDVEMLLSQSLHPTPRCRTPLLLPIQHLTSVLHTPTPCPRHQHTTVSKSSAK